ncbi:MAG: rod shape-determining protein MreC [Steroidobacteraceae bacterium]|nr:rod shape-determining protein MreC [Steroidobacteraceae bacterium]
MVTLSSDTRPIIGRGPPLGASFFFLALLAVTVMVLDHRSSYLQTARLWLGAAANPLYAVVQAPFDAWDWLTESFRDRSRLRAENARLTDELRQARVQLLSFAALREENRRLRQVREASRDIAARTLVAEIIRVDVDPFRHRVRLNKGAADGVFRGQPILDAFGIVGQIMQVDQYSSLAILVTDAEHAVPVLVNRNGLRTIASGSGDLDRLTLPFVTLEADIEIGDLLVSSGLDGVFPAGYPVGRISRVQRDPAETFAAVEAEPLAQLDRDREVLLVWVDQPPDTPAERPGEPEASSQPAQADAPSQPRPAQSTAGPTETEAP